MICFARRDFLTRTLQTSAALFFLNPLSLKAAHWLPKEKEKTSTSLSFYNIHTGDFLKNCEFFSEGDLSQEALQEINILFRDHRTGQICDIDPNLILFLWTVLNKIEANNALIHVVSGYRSVKSNTHLRKKSSGVAKNSQHTQGKAVDFYLERHSLTTLQRTAVACQQGGVGRYGSFVHIDTGAVRSW